MTSMSVPKYYSGNAVRQNYFYTPYFKSEPDGVVVLYPNGRDDSQRMNHTDAPDSENPNLFSAVASRPMNSKVCRKRLFILLLLLAFLILSVFVAFIFINLILPFYLEHPTSNGFVEAQFWENESDLSETVRLPETNWPTSYDLSLDFNLIYDSPTIQGSVIIKIDTKIPTDYILMHSEVYNIDFDATKMILSSGERVQISNQSVDSKTSFFLIQLETLLPVSKSNELQLKFTSKVSLHPHNWGLYSTDYDLKGGISTQFQPGWARKLFPCFDEPAFKSIFRLNVSHDSRLLVLSNMPEKKNHSVVESGTSLKRNHDQMTEFEATPLMSTYLLGLYIVPKDPEQTKFSFVYNSSLIPGYSFVVRGFLDSKTNYEKGWEDTLVAVLNGTLLWCEQVFGEPYRLPKLDLVWVYHLALGMENWGLITIRSDMSLTMTTMTIIHEILHQWLGNVASIEWWSDIWITEALVTYLEHKIYQGMPFLEQNLYELLLIQGFQTRNDPDALYPEITAPDSHTLLDQTFIVMATYQKGAWLYSGVEKLTSFETVKACSRLFYNRFSTESVNMQKFLALLTECTASKLQTELKDPIGEILMSWLEKGGMPIVSVDKSPDGSFIVAQIPSCKTEEVVWICPEQSALWKIPLFITDYHGTLIGWEYLDEREKTFPGYGEKYQILFNYNLSFPYSVQYSNEIWNDVISGFKAREIDPFQACLIMGDLKNNLDVASCDMYPALKLFEVFDRSDFEFYKMMNPFQFLYFIRANIVVPKNLEKELSTFIWETAQKIQIESFCLEPGNYGVHESNTLACMMFFQTLCHHDMPRCRELVSERGIGHHQSQSVSCDSILVTLVNDANRTTQERVDFIVENLLFDPVLMALIVDRSSLLLLWPDLSQTLMDEVARDGYVTSDQFLRQVLISDPNLNELVATSFLANLTQEVLKRFPVRTNNEEMKPGTAKMYEILSIYSTLIIESSKEVKDIVSTAMEIIEKQIAKLGSNIIPMTLRLKNFDMHTRNQNILIDFLQRRQAKLKN